MDVSIIFVNYNTHFLLRDAVDSVLEKTKGISYEIIIVDNNSDIKPFDFLEYDFENFHYINLDENIGFGQANNKGLKIARGRNIFFLNPDTVLINNAIKILSEYLDDNQNVGACGGNLYDENMNPTHSFRHSFPGLSTDLRSLFFIDCILKNKNQEFNYSNKVIKVAYITGADLMIKKTILDKVGFFDPDFFMYYEETELSWRINKLGFEIKSIPSAKIQHLESRSFNGENKRKTLMLLRSRKKFYKKTNSTFKSFLLDLVGYITIIQRIMIFTIFCNKSKIKHWIFILKNSINNNL